MLRDELDEAPQTAMLLTDHEWRELGWVCRRYVRDTERFYGGADDSLTDRIALCQRVIKAAFE